MKLVILGASGLIGGNCLRHFTEEGHTSLGTHFSFETSSTEFFNTLNHEDPANVDIETFNPDVIVHCGALTWVDYCEKHPDESHEKTVRSTLNAINLAEKLNAKMVYLSTDYVKKKKKGFYSEDNTTNPLSVYAKHKLEAEQEIQQSGLDHLICRVTNVYGDEIRGKNFIVRLITQMKDFKHMELKLPVDQYATPVNAWDVARAILKLVNRGDSGLYHLASTDYFNRVQLAERVIHYFGHAGISLIPVTTAQLAQPAPRPLLGGMNADKFNREFPDFRWSNVDDYLRLKAHE